MSLCVIIPMKDPDRAKSRLGDQLAPQARAALARTLFRNTLAVLRSLPNAPDILVVSASSAIEALCDAAGVAHLADCDEGLNAAVSLAANHAEAEGYRSICVLPGDLADPDPLDLEALFDLPRAYRSIVLCPAHDGGTNALIATPPTALPFAYGTGSAAAHQRLAREAGLSVIAAPLDSLLHDVDTRADLGRRLNRGLQRAFVRQAGAADGR